MLRLGSTSTRCPNDEVPWPRVLLFCLLRLCIACIPHQPHMEMDHAAPPELPPETVSQLASWPTIGTGLQKEVASKGSVGLKGDPLSRHSHGQGKARLLRFYQDVPMDRQSGRS